MACRFRQGLVEAREWNEQMWNWHEERRKERLKQLDDARLADLKISGELLRQAKEIRALAARVEEAMLEGRSPDLTAERISRWKQWALARADEIDPVLSGQVLTHLYVPDLDGE